MSVQIRPSVTNPTIAGLYREISDGILVLAPEFQRKFVWTQEHQEQFIDTILNGLPFPEIYVSTGEVDIELMRTVRHVIDGQQRLTTIKNYIDGRSDRPFTLVRPYAELNKDEKSEFLSYEVVVRDLGKINPETVREIFRRINLTKFKLDTIEIHNAIYDGKYIQAAKDILDSTDISVFGVFKESEFSRMADLHFVLLVMTTLEAGGYFAQDSEVENFIERYNEEYPDTRGTTGRLKFSLNMISDLGLPPDSMWFRKSNFFTLVCEVAMNSEQLVGNLGERLLDLEERVMKNKNNSGSEYGVYYSYMYQNTNGRKARIIRSEMFRKFCVRK